MREWARNRGSAFEHSFQADLKRLGLDQRDFDVEVGPEIDEALCGATDGKLDEVYPEFGGGLRILLVTATAHLPALRIAFRVDAADGGKICYCRVDLR